MSAASPRSRPAAKAHIDYVALFAATPTPYLVLTPDLVVCEANSAYLEVTRTVRDDILGRSVFDVFPDNPDDPSADGMRNLRASLERARRTGRPDSMAVQRYDIRVSDGHGGERFVERYWSPTNTPVLDETGLALLVALGVRSLPGVAGDGRSTAATTLLVVGTVASAGFLLLLAALNLSSFLRLRALRSPRACRLWTRSTAR